MDNSNTNKKTVSLKKSELKQLLKEVVKEMIQTGEFSKLLAENAGGYSQPNNMQQYNNQNGQRQPQRQMPRDPTVSAIVSMATTADPAKREMLESIFMDTKMNPIHNERIEMEKRYDTNPFNNGYNNQPAPQYQQYQQHTNYGVSQPQGYANNNMFSQPVGYTGEDYSNNHVQQPAQQNVHPFARIAFGGMNPPKNNMG
jgi:hypothetical protein